MNKDLTAGNPYKVLWLYTLPLLGSILFQQLYNIADSLVAGKFLGENALAAVGNASEITLIYTAFAFGSNIGCSVVVSNLFGSKNFKDMKSCISTAFITFGALCVLLMLFGFIGTRPLLVLMKTPQNIIDDSFRYLMIYTAGIPFVFFYNVATGIFSAMGDSKTPFYFLAFSSLSNIAVDVLFVKFTPLGVSGVAYATLICQGVSCLLVLVFLAFRLKTVETPERAPVFSVPLFGKILKIAIPSILQQGCISVGNIVIQGLVNGYGETTMAGFTAAIKLNNIATSCFMATANGLSAYTAQNMGAKEFERVRPGLTAAILLNGLIAILLIILFTAGGSFCISLFMDQPTAGALPVGKQFLSIVSPFYLLVTLKITSDGVLRGSGAMHLFMISTFADLILRVVLAIGLSDLMHGFIGICWSWPIGWVVGAGISLFFYLRGSWKKSKI